MPHSPRFTHGTLVALTTLVLAGAAHAQAHPTSVAPDDIRHIQSISPRSGPPGTLVSVSTLNLTLEARVHVGIGAMREGFETLTEAEQGRWGEIAVRVQVPTTTSWDRPIVFVAFNAIFAPIGMSDPFHVTNEDGMIRRRGQAVETGQCLTFRDEDEYVYELTGRVEDLEPGVPVQIDGVYFDTGPCTGGPTIGVSEIQG